MSNETGKISRKNKKQSKDDEDQPELTKEEMQVARFLRLSCPHKQGNLVGMKVDFFIGSKLVDCLMESKWGPQPTGKSSKTASLFFSRQACVSFMQRLMNKQMFYRATKIYKESSNLSVENKENSDVTPNLKKRKTAANKEVKEGETPQTSQQTQQKRKFKLEMHDEQKFLDSTDPFVWVYDPTSTKTYIIGSLLILGAIGICLFPLWPSQVREGVYYLSLGGASLLGAILALAGIKYVLFAFLWMVTLGKLHFWLFPNLTEDVGFFESFVPVYKCNLGSSSSTNNKTTTSSKSESKTKKPDTPVEANQPAVAPEQAAEPTPQPTPASSKRKSSTVSTISTNSTNDTDVLLKTTTNELSKSTLEINTVDVESKKEDDGFELVDDEDLDKQPATTD